MPKIPTLGAVAEAQAEDEKQKKAKGLLAKALVMLGLSGGDAKPDAKMTKRTLTTKRVEMEESDTGAEEEEEESGEEEMDSETDMPESTGDTSDTADSKAEEEEEEAEEEEGGKHAKYEEEEESKALARAVSKALNSPAVHEAFLAALPKRHRDAGALFSPHRLASAAKRATGAATTYAAMHALADLRQQAKGRAEAVLKQQAKLERRVVKIEGARRADRVNAIITVAKEKGVPGATTKQGREQLRAYGMQHGTKALSLFIQSQGEGLRRDARAPKEIQGASGAPTSAEQERMIELAMNGLDEKGRAQFLALLEEDKKKALSGASKPGGML